MESSQTEPGTKLIPRFPTMGRLFFHLPVLFVKVLRACWCQHLREDAMWRVSQSVLGVQIPQPEMNPARPRWSLTGRPVQITTVAILWVQAGIPKSQQNNVCKRPVQQVACLFPKQSAQHPFLTNTQSRMSTSQTSVV